MTTIGWLQIIVFFAAIVAVTKPIGVYMFRVFEGDRQPLPRVLGRFERLYDDLDAFLRQVGVSLSEHALRRIRESPPLKATHHRPYREYYDDELRQIVGEKCDLVQRFGYAF